MALVLIGTGLVLEKVPGICTLLACMVGDVAFTIRAKGCFLGLLKLAAPPKNTNPHFRGGGTKWQGRFQNSKPKVRMHFLGLNKPQLPSEKKNTWRQSQITQNHLMKHRRSNINNAWKYAKKNMKTCFFLQNCHVVLEIPLFWNRQTWNLAFMLLLANGRQRDDIAHGAKKRSLVTWISVFFFPKRRVQIKRMFSSIDGWWSGSEFCLCVKYANTTSWPNAGNAEFPK